MNTARLKLRPWTSEDLEALHRVWSDPLTIWWGAHEQLEQTRALLEKILAQDGWWAVEHEGEVVGNVFLRASPRRPEVLELGYHFRSAYWGKGFATEAALALLETAKGKVVEAPVVPENVRSRRVMRKLGFSVAGQIMQADRLHDLWIRSPSP